MYARVSPVSGAENDLCPPTAQCRLVTTIVPVVAMILMWASPEPAIAGLCPVDLIEGVHRTEARELESAGFSAGSSCAAGSTSCWIGDRDYNARVISCNRSRDIDVIRFGPIKDIPFVHKPAGKLLDERTAAERQFDADLDPRMITGKYRYLGAFKKWYGYLLERQGGEWVVTVTLDFQFPKQEEDKLHIPLYLMERLSDSAGGSTLEFGRCASYSTSDTVDGRIEVKGAGGVLVDRSCRIGRDDELFLAVPDTFLPATLGTTTSRPATEWLMLYFREVVDQTWNRPSNSFRLQTEIANLAGRAGEIDRDTLEIYRGGGVVFEMEMHHNETRWNYMFRPITVEGTASTALYTGIPPDVAAHEFGHSLGLGDDYPGRQNPPADKDCEALSGQDGGDQFRYVMCDEGDLPQDAKSVYLWIVTQRYSIGKDLYCGGDEDCENHEYCKSAGLTGRRSCVPKKRVGEGCSRPANCLSGRCPAIDFLCAECNNDGDCANDEWCEAGIPRSANTCKPKGRVGAGCSRPNQCITGLCPAIDLQCAACTRDGDCDSDQYCESGKVGSANRCRGQKANGESCSRPNQCRSGLCPAIDLKCAECTDDDHCGNNEYCKTGAVLSQNTCEAKKANGEGCSRPDQCLSGLCPAIDLKCAECTSDSHCDNDEYCREGVVLTENECRALKADGEGCSRPGQCQSGLCPVPDFVCVECTENSHCNSNQYCDKGVALGLGANQCKAKRSQGEACSKNSMCVSDCCKYMPLKFRSECRPADKC